MDALINIILGALLIAYPRGLVELLGLPEVRSTFYPNVLGGVLLGIGIALVVSWRGGVGGLGLDGAIVINLCGAGIVVAWLLVAPGGFSVTGRTTLWIVALAVLGIGGVELGHRFRTRPR